MAGVTVEIVLVEITETIIEVVAEDVAETTVEETSEEFVESELQELLQTEVQESVQTAVEGAVEGAADTAAENAAEESVEQSVEQAQTSFWKRAFWRQVFPALVAGITSGVVIEIIKRIVDKSVASSEGSASEMSKETKDKLLASRKLLVRLKEVTARWEGEIKEYKDMHDAFGTFKFNTKVENANTIVAILVTSMKSDLEAVSTLAEKSDKDKSWNKNITEFQWYLIDAVSRLLAVYKVKAASKKMQDLGFPLEKDERILRSELEEDFPNYKTIIKELVKKHLRSAVAGDAAAATQAAAQMVVKPLLEKEITKQFNKTIRPSALAEGKKAAKAEVTLVFNEWASRINLHAAIPIYGISTLKQWIIHNIEPEAKRKAEEKASAAAKATVELPDAQIEMMKISHTAKEKVLSEHREEINKVVLDAAKKAIENAQKYNSEQR